jgi:mono/diheme cytochrome c family protein
MKKTILILTALTGAVILGLIACTSGVAKTETTSAIISKDSLIKRGSYLVNSIGCDDCHTPKKFGPNGPELDMEHRFGGHLANSPVAKVNTSVIKDGWALFAMDLTSAVGPWGQSYAANISSDATGIGNWSEEQFMRALREGKSKGLKEGRPLLPPMPWFMYKNMNDTDIKAIFAYLKTSKPVENRVPGPKTLAELK